MATFSERRHRNRVREVAWAQRHPKLGRAALWFLLFLVVGELVMALVCVVQANWVGTACYASATVGIAWISREWSLTIRGVDRSPPLLRRGY